MRTRGLKTVLDMQIVTLPDGRRIPLDGCTYQAVGNALVITQPNGATLSYPCNTASAASLVSAIDAGLAAATGVNSNTQLYDYFISSISPTSFDITTATLTINGSGFVAGTIGKICFEDAPGGEDSNSYYHTCTFVSATQLTTAYGGSGDGILDPSMIIYYQDSGGAKSNSIAASNPSGTLITIP